MLECFRTAVVEFGLPRRVCADRGGENVEVANYMLLHPLRGPRRGHSLPGGVCTTPGLNGYGEMFFRAVQLCTTIYSVF